MPCSSLSTPALVLACAAALVAPLGAQSLPEPPLDLGADDIALTDPEIEPVAEDEAAGADDAQAEDWIDDVADETAQEQPLITVRRTREFDREALATSLRSVSKPLRLNIVMPRYHDEFCPALIGLDRELAEPIIERLRANAAEIGARVGGERCQTNAVVMVLDEPATMFEQLIAKRPSLLGPYETRDLHISALRADLKARKPVVTWNRIGVRSTDGPAITGGGALPALGGGAQFGEGVPVTQSPFGSRVRASAVRAKELSVVLFDKKQLVDVSVTQLADLSAIYLLGSPRREINYEGLGASTLLTLFRDGPQLAPSEWTAFDRAYLKGIYALERNAWSNRVVGLAARAYRADCAAADEGCELAGVLELLAP